MNESMANVRCYLCGEKRPKTETEKSVYTVPSSTRGGTVQGVKRYVRMCRVGHGCKRHDDNVVAGTEREPTGDECQECNNAPAVTAMWFNGRTLVDLCEGCADYWRANGLNEPRAAALIASQSTDV